MLIVIRKNMLLEINSVYWISREQKTRFGFLYVYILLDVLEKPEASFLVERKFWFILLFYLSILCFTLFKS